MANRVCASAKRHKLNDPSASLTTHNMSTLPRTIQQEINKFLYFPDLKQLVECSRGIKAKVLPLNICADYAKHHNYQKLFHFLMRQWLRVRGSPIDLEYMRVAFMHFISHEDYHHLQWFILQFVQWDNYIHRQKEFLREDCEAFVVVLKAWIECLDDKQYEKSLFTLYIGTESLGRAEPRSKLEYAYAELDEQIEGGFDLSKLSLLVLAYRAVDLINKTKFAINILKKIAVDLHAVNIEERNVAIKVIKIFLDRAVSAPPQCLNIFFGVFAKADVLTLDKLISCFPRMIHLDVRQLERLNLSHIHQIALRCPDLQTLHFQETKILKKDQVRKIMLENRPKIGPELAIICSAPDIAVNPLVLSPTARFPRLL